ncbi:hypothetical protein BRC81_08905 [Halobacteriales archaeon QS_1_68_20]|nr:MAG: hypothetical protein BRC81_08905 [Halobacteriales archaeon QS_1_68_20]
MSEGEGLQRTLGFFEATSIGLGTMIGGGIFILPSVAAAQAGPASAISFALAGLISLLSALSHAELATAMHEAGGAYQYVHRALGPLAGSVVGWGMWIGLVFASAFYAVGFAQYLTFFSGLVPVAVAAVALALVLTALNYYGGGEAGELQDVIVLALLVIILSFVGLGVPAVDGGNLSPFAPQGWAAVLTTTGTVYVALIGFGLIAAEAGEIKRPDRNIPWSMVVSVVVPTVLYVAVMVVSTGVLPIEELSGSRIPVADVARAYAGPLGALAMTVGAVLATISSANASILSAGRVTYAMGADRVLTDRLHSVHPSFGTPYRAILLTGAGIALLVVLRVGIDVLAEVASFMFLLTYGLVHVALVRLRHGEMSYDPEFTIPWPLYPVAPAVGVLATLGVMAVMDPLVIFGGATIVVASVVWYYVYVEADLVHETAGD